MSRVHLIALLSVLLPAGGLAAAFLFAPSLYEEDLATPFAHREATWTGSTTCKSCHPDQFASWDRTFHSTMTQEATPESVVGAFNGESVTYWGVTTRPVRRGDKYFIEYLDPTGKVRSSFQVKLTVGSRRFQQSKSTAHCGYLRWQIIEYRYRLSERKKNLPTYPRILVFRFFF